jgi:hypothetical protein
MEMIKLLLEHKADVNLMMADRQTPIIAALAGRASEKQALEIIDLLQKAGADVNVVALVNHREDSRGGTALHYATRKRYKEVIKNSVLRHHYECRTGQPDGARLYAGPRLCLSWRNPVYKDEAALLRELGATLLLIKNPEWPILGPPQGIEEDIWPIGDSREYAPFYTHDRTTSN